MAATTSTFYKNAKTILGRDVNSAELSLARIYNGYPTSLDHY